MTVKWLIFLFCIFEFLVLHPEMGHLDQWHTQEFCLGGVQQIQLRTERENGDLGAVAP